MPLNNAACQIYGKTMKILFFAVPYDTIYTRVSNHVAAAQSSGRMH